MTYRTSIKVNKGSLIFGIMILLGGICFFLLARNYEVTLKEEINSYDYKMESEVDWITTRKYDSDDGYKYSPIYHYYYEGNIYKCSSKETSSTKDGEGYVYFMKNNPTNCLTDFDVEADDTEDVLYTMSILGGIIGVICCYVYYKKYKDFIYLLRNGCLIKGVPCTFYDSAKKYEGRNLKIASCNVTFPNGVNKTVTSGPLEESKSMSSLGNSCDVLYDPKNINRFIVGINIEQTGRGNPHVMYYQQLNHVLYGDSHYTYNNQFNNFDHISDSSSNIWGSFDHIK